MSVSLIIAPVLFAFWVYPSTSSNPNDTYYGYISNVRVYGNGIDASQTSGEPPYTNFTGGPICSTPFPPGTFTLEVTVPKQWGQGDQYYICAWADINMDGMFSLIIVFAQPLN